MQNDDKGTRSESTITEFKEHKGVGKDGRLQSFGGEDGMWSEVRLEAQISSGQKAQWRSPQTLSRQDTFLNSGT